MSEITLYDIQRWIQFRIWRPLRMLATAVHPLALIGGTLLYLLFGHSGQMREIYFALAENRDDRAAGLQVAAFVATLALASATLYLSNYSLSGSRIDDVYSGNRDSDRWLRSLRALIGTLSALLPWLGVAVGLVSAGHSAARMVEAVTAMTTDPIRGFADVADGVRAMAPWLRIAAACAVVMGLGTVAAIHATRHNARGRSVILGVLILMFLALLLLPLRLIDATELGTLGGGTAGVEPLRLVRAVGPLATTMLVANALFCIAVVIALLASQINFPVLPATVAVIAVMTAIDWPADRVAGIVSAVFVVTAVLAVLSRQLALTTLSCLVAVMAGIVAHQLAGTSPRRDDRTAAAAPAQKHVMAGFEDWLAARRDLIGRFAGAGRRYPAFIVAAQGGGIYAATAAQSFLSGLDGRCPSFADHVFAISAVSGGALGAALFQGGLDDGPPRTMPCRDDGAPTAPRASQRVVGDDHLSPLLGMLLADLFEVVPDRGRALELSFAYAARRHGLAHPIDGRFYAHWSAAGRRPALILNTTWSETGYRVAFSPFQLDGISDGTLLSFADRRLAGLVRRDPLVVEAAVASARFPGILPAYTVASPGTREAGLRWNFVDGGYADASGAATALDIYRSLARVLERSAEWRDKVELRLVLLTGFRPEVEFRNIAGSHARDTLAPATTLLNVRQLLSGQAVTRAVLDFRDRGDGRIALAELLDEKFELPLGWKISGTTQKLVAMLMGGAVDCRPQPARAAQHGEPAATSRPKPEPAAAAQTVAPATTAPATAEDAAAADLAMVLEKLRNNSCIVDEIATLVTPPAAAAAAR